MTPRYLKVIRFWISLPLLILGFWILGTFTRCVVDPLEVFPHSINLEESLNFSEEEAIEFCNKPDIKTILRTHGNTQAECIEWVKETQ